MFNLPALHVPPLQLLLNLIHLINLITITLSFNIDVKHPVIHRSAANSMFGYSIDFYQHEGMTL